MPTKVADSVSPAGRVFIPTKKEVPRSVWCSGCGGRTSAKPDANGDRWCTKCRPSERKRKGTVKRLCIKCDGTIYRSPNLAGPFFCTKCARTEKFKKGHYHGPELGTMVKTPELDANLQARIELLTVMYEAAEKAVKTVGETAARRAGLPTTSEEIPWSVSNATDADPRPAEADETDPDEAPVHPDGEDAS